MFQLTTLALIMFIPSIRFGFTSASVKKDIPKCCPENQMVVVANIDYDCAEYDPDTNFSSNIKVYDDKRKEEVRKKFNDLFNLEPGMRPNNEDFQFYLSIQKTYLGESGDLYVEYPNSYERWDTYTTSNYCIDFDNVSLSIKAFYNLNTINELDNKYLPIALRISSVFLFLLLVVYLLLPSLRNLNGKVLMSFVTSLLVASLFLAGIQEMDQMNKSPNTCLALSTIIYFFLLASFCWMNVMSYDIWWTFRGYAKARDINNRGKVFKFYMYSIYAWGVPLAVSIVFVTFAVMPLEHKPWIVKPLHEEYCFMKGGEKMLYLYVPMLTLITCNWMFFLMTAFNMWRLYRATAVLDSPAAGTPAAHRCQRQRLIVYLKLSVVMGVSWVLEAVSWKYPGSVWLQLIDWYNGLTGFVIFVIFVCKKSVYIQLKNRFSQWRNSQKTSIDSTLTSKMQQQSDTITNINEESC